jgi:hypothetical protein
MRLLCKFRSVNISRELYVRHIISGVICVYVGTLGGLEPGQLIYKSFQHNASRG